MQKRNVIILIIILVITISGLAIAGTGAGWFIYTKREEALPEAKSELKKLTEQIRNGESICMGGTITLYDGEKPSEVKETTTYRFIKRQDQFYSQLGYLQTFCNGNLIVQLDTINQYIIVSKADLSKPVKKTMQPSLDMLFDEKADFRITGSVKQDNDNNRTISLQSDFNPEMKVYELTYDPSTYKVRHAVIQWWKEGGAFVEKSAENRVWISKIQYQELPQVDMNIHEEINKIITIKNDQIEPALKYQDYTMHVSNPEQ